MSKSSERAVLVQQRDAAVRQPLVPRRVPPVAAAAVRGVVHLVGDEDGLVGVPGGVVVVVVVMVVVVVVVVAVVGKRVGVEGGRSWGDTSSRGASRE